MITFSVRYFVFICNYEYIENVHNPITPVLCQVLGNLNIITQKLP